MSNQNDDSGALFKNDRKRNDKDPAYKGNCTIGGREYWISGWVNESRNGGAKYFGLKFNPKDESAAKPKTSSIPQPPPQEDDEIPF